MERSFNIAGPCVPGKHYMIPAIERYLGAEDKAILVGAGFSLKTRNIKKPKIETA